MFSDRQSFRFLFSSGSCDTGRLKVLAQHFDAQQITADAEDCRHAERKIRMFAERTKIPRSD